MYRQKYAISQGAKDISGNMGTFLFLIIKSEDNYDNLY